jgi:signal transduction histidine kinase
VSAEPLLALVEAVGRATSLAEAVTSVVNAAAAVARADVCFAYLLDEPGQALVLSGATSPYEGKIGHGAVQLGLGVTGWVGRHHEPAVIVDRKEADGRYLPVVGLAGTDFTSMVSVPMADDLTGLVGVLDVHSFERRAYDDGDVATLSRLARVVAGPLQAAVLVSRMAELERTRERFTERAIAAQEAERSRLASDIHDGISQRLVSLSYHLDAAGGLLLSDPGLAAEQIRTAQQLARLGMAEARAAIRGLRPPVLDDLGLTGGLTSLARSVEATAGMDIVIDLVDVRMPEHVEVALYRIAQEALQNMVKHAKAGLAWVGLSFGNGTARLEVADDGVGFDVPTAWDSGGFGLRSMRERAELVGGRLSVRSRPGGGTSITVTAPAIALP